MRGVVSIISLTALFAAGTAQADLLGAEFGAGGWSQDPGGWAQYDGEKLDVDDDMNLDKETGGYAYAKIEHPIPVLPNFRLYYGQSSFDGEGTVSRERTFGAVTFNANQEIRSEADLDYVDGTVYYEVLDNVVSADVGLNVRYMSGNVKVTHVASGDSEEVDLNLAFPMLYAMLRADVPATGLFVKAEGTAMGYGGNRIADVMIGGGYDISLVAARLGIEAGYKQQQIKLDDVDSVNADINIKGPYAGVYVDF